MDATRRTAFFSIGGAVALAGCAGETAAAGLSSEQFAAWLQRYGAAWESRDASAAGALFAEDATYQEMPFDAPKAGRAAIEAYWAEVTAPQSNISFSYDVIACEGEQGVAHWRAAFDAGGARVELDGVFVCTFGADRSIASGLREWWHVRSTPPAN